MAADEPLEVELKFELPAEAQAAFAGLSALAGARPSREQLFAMYFDTPAHDLARNEMAMRLRRSGRRWKQCLKAGASGTGGLHARTEWELDRPDASIDLSLFPRTPLAALPRADRLHENLSEVFRVEVARTTWQVELAPGTRVEVALDRGEVRHGNAAEAISEVEIESLEGEPLAVFDFAERLVDALPLRPSAITKAQRGYRLARRDQRAAVKGRAVKLDEHVTPREGARATLAASLATLQANEAGALETTDPEYLHQIRVALRRLRSALRVYRPALDPGFARAAGAELGWLAEATGGARDWDVLATETLPALLKACGKPQAARSLAARVGTRRRAEREAMRAALRSPRYARLVLLLARHLAQAPAAQEPARQGMREFAAERLRKRYRKLERRAKHARSHHGARDLHRLRIEAKKLRYALEGFAALYPRKRVKAYVEVLARIQQELGRANDAAVAGGLLAGLKLAHPLAQFARGWLDARRRAAARHLARHLERLDGAARFWEKT